MTNAQLKKAGVGRANKYGNQKKLCHKQHRHDSSREAERCGELHLLQRAGEISELVVQRPFELVVNDVKVGCYLADFTYIDEKKKEWIIEDVKGVFTQLYQLKKKLMRACYGIEILETK